VASIQRYLGWLWLVSQGGILAELVMEEHTESSLQWIPLVLVVAGLAGYVWFVVAPGGLARKALRVLMVLQIVAGLTGVVLHMRGKMEFKQESDRSLSGWTLLVASLESKSPPALAPGAMVQLGLLGLVWLYTGSSKEKWSS
jgi:hypothetical protein